MITADTIKTLANLNTRALDQALINAGYKDLERVMAAEFLGITNGGEFSYQYTYREDESWGYGKLFVKFNNAGVIVAEF